LLRPPPPELGLEDREGAGDEAGALNDLAGAEGRLAGTEKLREGAGEAGLENVDDELGGEKAGREEGAIDGEEELGRIGAGLETAGGTTEGLMVGGRPRVLSLRPPVGCEKDDGFRSNPDGRAGAVDAAVPGWAIGLYRRSGIVKVCRGEDSKVVRLPGAVQ